MTFFTHFLLGLMVAYIGLIPPGMLNMTTARTSLLHGMKYALLFSFGACIIVGIHAIIAFYFADYLNEHPSLISNLRFLGMVVLFALAYFFWVKAKKQFLVKGKEELTNPFLAGLGMSSLNMLGIPFYLGMSAILAARDIIILEWPYIMFLTLGATSGSFLLFMTYGFFAKTIDKKVGFLSRNINYILSALFLILALLIGINLFI